MPEWRIFARTVFARAYPRMIVNVREKWWMFFDVLLPLVALSAYVFVYRSIHAPEEFVGFVILGTLLSLIDLKAQQRLVKGDWHSFAMWYLPGLCLLQTGGSLVEVTSSAGAALVTVVLVNRFVVPDLGGRVAAPATEEARHLAG